jgi:hypothetical protein
VVACGAAPRGKVAVVRSGCGLLPLLLDGPELPVGLAAAAAAAVAAWQIEAVEWAEFDS